MADPSNNDPGPWLEQPWVIPPKASGAFVAAREDAIAVYRRPGDADRPVGCVEEAGEQLIGDVREPLPARAGGPAEDDGEYERHGTASLSLAFEPRAGRRVVEVTDRRIPDRATLAREAATWAEKRNAAGVTADWQFTTADARVKLEKLYTTIHLR